MCEQQTECLSQLLYYDHMMNTATPTDDATAAATETTITVNEERAQIRKHNRLAATQTSFKDMAEANAGTNVKPSSGENEGIDSNTKQDASDDDNDDFQGNDDDEDDETSSRNARERLQHNPTKRRRSKTDVDEYVPMTFPQKVRTECGTRSASSTVTVLCRPHVTLLSTGVCQSWWNTTRYCTLALIGNITVLIPAGPVNCDFTTSSPHFPFRSCFTANGDSFQRRKLRYHLLVT